MLSGILGFIVVVVVGSAAVLLYWKFYYKKKPAKQKEIAKSVDESMTRIREAVNLPKFEPESEIELTEADIANINKIPEIMATVEKLRTVLKTIVADDSLYTDAEIQKKAELEFQTLIAKYKSDPTVAFLVALPLSESSKLALKSAIEKLEQCQPKAEEPTIAPTEKAEKPAKQKRVWTEEEKAAAAKKLADGRKKKKETENANSVHQPEQP